MLAPLGGAARAPRGERARGPRSPSWRRRSGRRPGSSPARTCPGSTGAVCDTAALAAGPALVLLDGAQGLGAVPVNVGELGCDFYAASGQKWLCGPNGLGYLYVRGELAAELPPPWPSYGVPRGLARGARARPPPRRPALLASAFRRPTRSNGRWPRSTCSRRRASRRCMRARPTWPDGLAGARRRAWRRAGAPRWSPGRSPTRRATVGAAAPEGLVVRDLPGHGTVRASVGRVVDRGRVGPAGRSSLLVLSTTMPNTIDRDHGDHAGHPDHAEEDRLPDSPLAPELDRARGAEDREAVRRRRADARRQRRPDDREQRVPVDDREPSCLDAAAATGALARRALRTARPAGQDQHDTTSGPAAPVPNMRVTP